MPRIYKGSETIMRLLIDVPNTETISKLRIAVFTDDRSKAMEFFEDSMTIYGNIVYLNVPEWTFIEMNDGIINYIANGEIDNKPFVMERQSNYMLKSSDGFEQSDVLNGYYTKSEVDTRLDLEQDKLISGQTIKTINNQSILGAGNLNITAEVDLDGYATEEWVESKDYATQNTIDTSLGNYYTKEEIDTSLGEYYTKEEIDELIAGMGGSDSGVYILEDVANLFLNVRDSNYQVIERINYPYAGSDRETHNNEVIKAIQDGKVSTIFYRKWNRGEMPQDDEGNTREFFTYEAIPLSYEHRSTPSRDDIFFNGLYYRWEYGNKVLVEAFKISCNSLSGTFTYTTDGEIRLGDMKTDIDELKTFKESVNNAHINLTSGDDAASGLIMGGVIPLKTINGQSILNAGDIVIEGGSGGGANVHIYPVNESASWDPAEVYNQFMAGEIIYLQLEDGRMGLVTDVSNIDMVRLNGFIGDESGDAKPNRFECSSPYGIATWKLAFNDEIPEQFVMIGIADESNYSIGREDLLNAYITAFPTLLLANINGKTTQIPLALTNRHDDNWNEYFGAYAIIENEIWKWEGTDEYLTPVITPIGGSGDMSDYYTKTETDALIADLEIGGESISGIVESAVSAATSDFDTRMDSIEDRIDALDTGNGGAYVLYYPDDYSEDTYSSETGDYVSSTWHYYGGSDRQTHNAQVIAAINSGAAKSVVLQRIWIYMAVDNGDGTYTNYPIWMYVPVQFTPKTEMTGPSTIVWGYYAPDADSNKYMTKIGYAFEDNGNVSNTVNEQFELGGGSGGGEGGGDDTNILDGPQIFYPQIFGEMAFQEDYGIYTDTASGIACGYKMNRAMINNLWAQNLHLGNDSENSTIKVVGAGYGVDGMGDDGTVYAEFTRTGIKEGNSYLSDKYVLKSDYDALLARVEALENNS